jgi:hypothetical protein
MGKPYKSTLASKSCNPWDLKPEFNLEAQSSTNLILKDEINLKYY